jgi:hypothetical protein
MSQAFSALSMLRKTEEPPSCFGKQWDPKVAECAGGLDPAYTDPRTGSHTRERCHFFDNCGTRKVAGDMEQHRLISAQSLVRPQPVAAPSGNPAFQQFIAQHNAAIAAQQQLHRTIAQQQAPVAPHFQSTYQQMMPVNYQMPGYLTVPELHGENDRWYHVLGRIAFRSIGKALGHSISHFFDTLILGPRPPQPPSNKGGEGK